MTTKIWIYAEVGQGALQPVALELATKARELGEVEAVVLGPGAAAATSALGRHGVVKAYINEDPAFSEYLAEPAVDTLVALVEEHRPAMILFGFTYDSREVAGRLSARLGVGLIANADALAAGDGGFAVRVPYFGGAKVARMTSRMSPAIVLLKPRSVEASEAGGEAQVETVAAVIGPNSRRARIVERVEEASEKVSLEAARVVVSGGRGMGGPENFPLLDDLADALGGAVGASRAVVDAGWVPYSMQIGQTGKTVRPGVYIACGISGAMQHTVGMKASRVIIAINKDAEAPILKMADLGVVGDALKIVPQLTAAIRSRRA